jgi:hypothetical protein
MFRLDGEVFLLGTAMAEKLLANAPPGHRRCPEQISGAKKRGAE